MKLTSAIIHLFAAVPGAFARGYCNWGPEGNAASSVCNRDVQGGEWCNEGQENCESGCGGKWCTNDQYCNWGPKGTADSSVCDGEVQGGPWCNDGQGNCEKCGGRWCITWPAAFKQATTTRYWDCSGGACACSYVPTGMPEDEPVHCPSNAMFAAPEGNPFGAKFYGAAAASQDLGGGSWMAEACGKCWKVTGVSNAPGYEGVETTLVLKGTNFCTDENEKCHAGPHFDIAAPGFDVLVSSFANTCQEREPNEAAGFAACADWLQKDQDSDANCNCSLFNDPVLRTGCENFYSLKWDNPTVDIEETICPEELARLHCSHPYAHEENMPETCASNSFPPALATHKSVDSTF